MFLLLNDKLPTKTTSGEIVHPDGHLKCKYMASRSKETYKCYLDNKVVGSIYVTKKIIKELNVESENVQVAGEYLNFLQLTGLYGIEELLDMNAEILWDLTLYQTDTKTKGSNTKLKDFTYSKLELVSNVADIDISRFQDPAQFIYRMKTVDQIVKEQSLNLDWLAKKNYRVLRTKTDIKNWIAGLHNYDDSKVPVGFDTESSGLEANRLHRDILVGLCMSYENHGGVYIPVNHLTTDNCEYTEKELLDLLKPYFDKRSKLKKNVVTHNGKFDWKIMKMYGWELNITHDTLVRQALMNIGEAGNIMKLKDIIRKELQIDVIEMDDTFDYPTLAELNALKANIDKISIDPITKRKLMNMKKPRDLLDFRYVQEDFYEIYGGLDADGPRLVLQATQQRWEEEQGKLDFTEKLEIALIPMLAEQEFYGIKVNVAGIEKLYDAALSEMETLKESIFKEVGYEFKIGGNQTVIAVYDQCKVPHVARFKTKKGERSVDKFALDYYKDFTNRDGTPTYPIVHYLARYNKLKTLVSSFYGKLPSLVTEGYIFPQYNNLRAETGRLTCASPNIQQTEPSSREYLNPDSDDYYFMVCDFSQVEARLRDGLSNETASVQKFRDDPEADSHIMAYAMMYGVPYESVTSNQRKEGKKLNFGATYGLQASAMALNLFGDDSPLSVAKAQALIDKYWAGIPSVSKYFDGVRNEAQKSFYARTIFGRKRFVPQFKAAAEIPEGERGKEFLVAKGRRISGNMPVQGLAADIMKLAMIRLRATFRANGYEEDMARAVLNVHDEVCYQLHKSIHPYTAIKIMREAMEINFWDKYGIPPLYIGGNVGYSWLDGKKDSLEAPVLLMDEMVEKAKVAESQGIVLQGMDDPKQFWADEITDFALRQVALEIDNGWFEPSTGITHEIKTIDDALKNSRVMKYSGHFESKANYIIGQIMLRGLPAVQKNISQLLSDETLPIEMFKKVAAKGLPLEQAKKSPAVRMSMEWYNKWGATMLNHFLLGNTFSSYEIVKPNNEFKGGLLEVADEANQVHRYDKALALVDIVKTKGQQVEETREDLESRLLQKVDIGSHKIVLDGRHIHPTTLVFLQDMLMPITFANQKLSHIPNYSLHVFFKDDKSDSYYLPGVVLVESLIPHLKRLLILDELEEDFDELQKDIQNTINNLM